MEEGLPSVLKGKWGTPVPEMAIMLDDRWLGTLAAPPIEMSISIEAPQIVPDMAGQKINFLTDTRATYSVLICHAGPHASKSCTVTGVSVESLKPILPLHLSLANLSCDRFCMPFQLCLSVLPLSLGGAFWAPLGPYSS